MISLKGGWQLLAAALRSGQARLEETMQGCVVDFLHDHCCSVFDSILSNTMLHQQLIGLVCKLICFQTSHWQFNHIFFSQLVAEQSGHENPSPSLGFGRGNCLRCMSCQVSIQPCENLKTAISMEAMWHFNLICHNVMPMVLAMCCK